MRLLLPLSQAAVLLLSIGLIHVGIAYGAVPGAKGDGKLASPTVTITASSKSLTVGSSIFASTDVGKVLIIACAGVSPPSGPVETIPIASSGAGYARVPAGTVSDASGGGSRATCSTLRALKSIATSGGGAGCVNGTQSFIVGIDGTGSPAQVTAIVRPRTTG